MAAKRLVCLSVGIITYLFVVGISYANGQVCSDTTFGSIDISHLEQDTTARSSFILRGDGTTAGIGAMTCYGVVKAFEFQCTGDGNLTIQVWRPESGSQYTFVGHFSTFVTCRANPASDTVTFLENPSCSATGSSCTIAGDNSSVLAPCGCPAIGCISSVLITGSGSWRFFDRDNYAGNYMDLTGPGCFNHADAVFTLPNDKVVSSKFLGIRRTLPIPENRQMVPIRPGDFIGIYQQTTGFLRYTSFPGSGGSAAGTAVVYRSWTTDPVVGTQYSIPASSGTVFRNAYSLTVSIGAGTPPWFANIPTGGSLPFITVYENTAIGTEIFKAKALDENSAGIWSKTGDNLTYYIGNVGANYEDYFAIDVQTGAVRTTKLLDYETFGSNHPQLPIIVCDGSFSGSHSSTAILTVEVLDVNDVIQGVNLPASISKNVQTELNVANAQIFQLQATGTTKMNFFYILLSSIPSDGSFQLNNSTGWLSTVGSLADTRVSSYTLEMAVVDQDGTFTSGSKKLYLSLTNLKTAPRFDNLPGVASVREDEAPSAVVFNLLTSDEDNDILPTSYAISSQPDTDMFILNFTSDPPAVVLSASPALDYENTTQYELNISVTDQLSYTTFSQLTVNILDSNEAPNCFPESFVVNINEKQPINSVVSGVVLNATDEDYQHDNQLTWTIETTTDVDLFRISDQKLYTAIYIDIGNVAEKTSLLWAKAVDPGGLHCSVNITLSIVNLNDPHTIVGVPDVITLDAKTTAANHLVTTVSAAPAEAIDKFTYRLGIVVPPDGVFSLNPITGQVTTTRSLQNILTAEYKLPISVHDQKGLSAGPEILTIKINNIRQNPVLNNLPSVTQMTENNPIGIVLFTVTASDADGDLNPATFTIDNVYPTSGTAMFSIQQSGQDGQVKTVNNQSCDHEQVDEYVLSIYVKDAIDLTSSSQNLTIVCKDENEAPSFITAHYTALITENINIGASVPLFPYNLNATDQDAGDVVEYHILSGLGNEYFTTSGREIMIAKDIDTDSMSVSSVTLMVVGRDRSGLQTTSAATITITIVDSNDHRPVFTTASYSDKLTENTSGGTFILSLSASDGDKLGTVNREFDYVINDTLGNSFFQVDPASGLLSVKQQIDYDKYPIVVFEVFAVDRGTPPLTGTTTVSILVEDVNDDRPVFIQDFYNLEIPSNSPILTSILTLNASDNDSDHNFLFQGSAGGITYTYLKHNHFFAVDSVSGDLTIRDSPEPNYKYLLYFTAKDNGIAPLTSNVAIVRIDSFSVFDYSVDIELAVAIGAYHAIQRRFFTALAAFLKPWIPKVYKVVGEVAGRRRLLQSSEAPSTRTVVSMYALENNNAESVADIMNDKNFITKSSLLEKLRSNRMFDTPSDDLKSTNFADFLVTRVTPTESIWLFDTVPGLAVLSIVSLLVITIIICCVVIICKKGPAGTFCKGVKERRVISVEERPVTASDVSVTSFPLNYNDKAKQARRGRPRLGNDHPEAHWNMVSWRKNRRVSTPTAGHWSDHWND